MIHTFNTATLPATPWKNGGGTTIEVVCQPPGAGMDSFDWRVSIATIAAAGPFSAFPGVDRVIMLLDGAGVRLFGGAIDHRLDTPSVPFVFSGDVALGCELLGGASTDFNLMTRRGRVQAEVRVVHATEEFSTTSGLLLAVRGIWQLGSLSCAPGHGLWWDAPAQLHAAPQTEDAMLVAVNLSQISL
ncbi:HutD family protein [Rhodoferax sp.]|uniref:HutD/Ves family protein n=1 Tax=Rhodoferax sp. TaxID=50421 RepID=UPI0025FE416F|nr:HutD family protein [Rhodoferax sp.]